METETDVLQFVFNVPNGTAFECFIAHRMMKNWQNISHCLWFFFRVFVCLAKQTLRNSLQLILANRRNEKLVPIFFIETGIEKLKLI